jgi:hypothetical protein
MSESEEITKPATPVVAMPSRAEQPEAEPSETNQQLIAVFSEILQNWQGDNTPAEELIWDLLVAYEARTQKGRGLTLQDVQWAYDSFYENFEAAIETAQRMLKLYPDLVCPKPQKATLLPAGA